MRALASSLLAFFSLVNAPALAETAAANSGTTRAASVGAVKVASAPALDERAAVDNRACGRCVHRRHDQTTCGARDDRKRRLRDTRNQPERGRSDSLPQSRRTLRQFRKPGEPDDSLPLLDQIRVQSRRRERRMIAAILSFVPPEPRSAGYARRGLAGADEDPYSEAGDGHELLRRSLAASGNLSFVKNRIFLSCRRWGH